MKKPKIGELRVARCPREIGKGYVVWDGIAYEMQLPVYASRGDAEQALREEIAHDESRHIGGDNY